MAYAENSLTFYHKKHIFLLRFFNMTIQRAREILGEKYAVHTNEEIQQIVNSLEILADISIETVLKMRSDESKKLKEKV